MSESERQRHIARVLVEIGAIKVNTVSPIRFKSGILSPVYVDNRSLPYHPEAWHHVIEAFQELVRDRQLQFDVIAGVAVGGIPHSAALSYLLKKPSIFVRMSAKEYGKKQLVEGGEIDGRSVLLVEDLVTTGGSSLSGVTALRDAGADVTECIAVISYGFPDTEKAFQQARVNLHTLTGFALIQEFLKRAGNVTEDEYLIVSDWIRSPLDWAARNGLI